MIKKRSELKANTENLQLHVPYIMELISWHLLVETELFIFDVCQCFAVWQWNTSSLTRM